MLASALAGGGGTGMPRGRARRHQYKAPAGCRLSGPQKIYNTSAIPKKLMLKPLANLLIL